jgi:hypothetical protein
MMRWLVVVLMIAAFCAPALIPADETTATLSLEDDQNGTPTGTFAVTALGGICKVVPDDVAKDYIDPVAGLAAVVVAAATFLLYRKLRVRCKSKKKAKKASSSKNEDGEKQKVMLSSKSARALNLLVQLLCVCFTLGHYLVWSEVRPQGGILCRVFGCVTLAIFYKPLVLAM